MPDDAPFLAAIAASPLDAAPRLIYADWLMERGRGLESALQRVLAEPDEDRHRLAYAEECEAVGDVELAEFIRVQVELARLPSWVPGNPNEQGVISHGVPNQKVTALRRRERELLVGHGNKWLCQTISFSLGVNLVPATEGGGATFRRGFVWDFACQAAEWLPHGDAMTAAHPVQSVTLTTWPDDEWVLQTCERIPDRKPGQLYGPEQALRFRWPTVKTWNLPPTMRQAIEEAARRINAATVSTSASRR